MTCKPGTKTVLLNMGPDLHEMIITRANQVGQSRSKVMRNLLEDALTAAAMVHLNENNVAEVRGIGRALMLADPQLFPHHDATVPYESLGTDGAKRQRRKELHVGIIACMREGVLARRKK